MKYSYSCTVTVKGDDGEEYRSQIVGYIETDELIEAIQQVTARAKATRHGKRVVIVEEGAAIQQATARAKEALK
ncbi:hypothetical protein ES707_11342 [subsurface metagenome]